MISFLECAVYILYEPDHIKIGMSELPAKRAQKVTPDVDKNISYALIFNSRKKARNCELALQRFFDSYRVHLPKRPGGTEFFNRSCAEKIRDFVTNNRELLGYKEIRSGENLFARGRLLFTKEEQEIRRLIQRGDNELSRVKNNGDRAKNFCAALEEIRNGNYFIGVSDQLNIERSGLSLFILYARKEQEETINLLRWNSLYQGTSKSVYFIDKREAQEVSAWETIDADFWSDMERVFLHTGPFLSVLDVLPESDAPDDHKERIREFDINNILGTLPMLDGEKLELAKEVLGIDQPIIHEGYNIFEEKPDESERRLIFYTRGHANEVSLKLCQDYWKSTLYTEKGNGEWQYTIYNGLSRGYQRVDILGRSQGTERHFHAEREDALYERNPIVATGSNQYEILNLYSIRIIGDHQEDSYTLYVYYYNDPDDFYAFGRSPYQAYQNLQLESEKRGWRIITP